MASSQSSSTHSKVEESASQSNLHGIKFHGQVEKINQGLFSSLTKRKSRRIPDDILPRLKKLDAYKLSADKMHRALIYELIENAQYSKLLYTPNLPIAIQMDRPYRNIGEFLGNFEKITKASRKGQYPAMEGPVEVFRNCSLERDSYVKKQLENLKPLITFIGLEYWEYSRLRNLYLDSLEAYDTAITAQSKERDEAAEIATQKAMKNRNDCKEKLMEYVGKLWDNGKPKHAECVVKYAEEAVKHHQKMAEILTKADVGQKSTVSVLPAK
ncbi:unnamed protein product [Caenorhabditis angaria]|uniref:BAR domain-containing protein n=1 Tax=Caenorhabditis angaria TaxID=860376 RepID=A0A9P1IG90_9PELO|nr:unnamed protein product [Caenorhabditis angaria]